MAFQTLSSSHRGAPLTFDSAPAAAAGAGAGRAAAIASVTTTSLAAASNQASLLMKLQAVDTKLPDFESIVKFLDVDSVVSLAHTSKFWKGKMVCTWRELNVKRFVICIQEISKNLSTAEDRWGDNVWAPYSVQNKRLGEVNVKSLLTQADSLAAVFARCAVVQQKIKNALLEPTRPNDTLVRLEGDSVFIRTTHADETSIVRELDTVGEYGRLSCILSRVSQNMISAGLLYEAVIVAQLIVTEGYTSYGDSPKGRNITESYLLISNAFAERGDTKRALHYAAKMPDHQYQYQAYSKIIEVYIRQKKLVEALAVIELIKAPNCKYLKIELIAVAYFEQGDKKMAQQLANRIPDNDFEGCKARLKSKFSSCVIC